MNFVVGPDLGLQGSTFEGVFFHIFMSKIKVFVNCSNVREFGAKPQTTHFICQMIRSVFIALGI